MSCSFSKNVDLTKNIEFSVKTVIVFLTTFPHVATHTAQNFFRENVFSFKDAKISLISRKKNEIVQNLLFLLLTTFCQKINANLCVFYTLLYHMYHLEINARILVPFLSYNYAILT